MTTPVHFADRLLHAITDKRAPVCVGLDPLFGNLPEEVRAKSGFPGTHPGEDAQPVDRASASQALREFCCAVIDTVADLVPAVKVNIAFFERYLWDGWRAYHDVIRHAHDAGLIVIGDIKRGDVGHTSECYARAHLGGEGQTPDVPHPDAVTLHTYLGWDAVKPFAELAAARGAGAFLLIQTSNESAAAVQDVQLPDGITMCQHVARIMGARAASPEFLGTRGYSCLGAVVSPRDVASTLVIRELMPRSLFLVPGYGAQGRTPAEVARCFKNDGTGAIVSASRSILYACGQNRRRASLAHDWCACIREACVQFVADVRAVVPNHG